MKKPDFKKIFGYAWPILGLLGFLIWGWIYVKPMLPEDFSPFENMRKMVGNIFEKKEAFIDPDEKYDFFYSHENLKPKSLETLSSLIAPELRIKEADKTVGTAEELQMAIRSAEPGAVIELLDGIYETNLFIDKDLTIFGQGTSTVIIGGEKGTAVYAKNSAFNISDCAIRKSNSALKILNSNGEIKRMLIEDNLKSGIEIRNGNFIVSENIIRNNGSYGIFADLDSELQVQGNYVADNSGFEVRIEKKRQIYR